MIAPSDYRVRAVRAAGPSLVRERVGSMADRWNAVLAVNGGFFRMGGDFDGNPVGILKVDDSWFSVSSHPRATLGWKDSGQTAVIDILQIRWQVEIGGEVFRVDGLNRVRGATETLLFTDAFGPSTKAGGGGVELQIGQDGRIQEISTSGDAPIPTGGYVLSFGSRSGMQADRFARGGEARILREFFDKSNRRVDELWEDMEYLVGGTPLLLKEGRLVEDHSVEKIPADFVDKRHPRTAVGRQPDGTWVFVVVDGRRPGLSVGMTIPELARLMQSLGCRDALNLDGGGSTTFYLYGEVVNRPSDLAGERPVTDAILVLEPE